MSLQGMRALVVEDDALICILLENFLGELGCDVVASAAHLDDGVTKAQTLPIDVAVLDINLNGHLSYPIALVLEDRSIPFVFATGYGKVPDHFKDVPVVAKPFGIEDLEQCLLRATQHFSR